MPMTSEEIRSATEDSKTLSGWVKELCYQVALSNETATAAARLELGKYMPGDSQVDDLFPIAPGNKLPPNRPIFDRSKVKR